MTSLDISVRFDELIDKFNIPTNDEVLKSVKTVLSADGLAETNRLYREEVRTKPLIDNVPIGDQYKTLLKSIVETLTTDNVEPKEFDITMKMLMKIVSLATVLNLTNFNHTEDLEDLNKAFAPAFQQVISDLLTDAQLQP